MKKRYTTKFFSKTLILAIALIANLMTAQRYELGVQGGISNLVGDVGRNTYILQRPFRNISEFGLPVYLGMMYKLNFNPYQGIKFNLGYSGIQFSDAHSDEISRKNRHKSGTNSVYNADVQFEYNFFPVNNEQKAMLSPYVFGGIGGIAYSNKRVTIGLDSLSKPKRIKNQYYTDLALSLPFGVGLKYKFNYNWALFGEIKFRYTFTDNLDYNHPLSKDVKIVGPDGKVAKGKASSEVATDYIKKNQFGNLGSNDWVNTLTLGLSYSFGRPPCYCD